MNDDINTVSCIFCDEFTVYKKELSRFSAPPMIMPKGQLLQKRNESHDWLFYICDGKVRIYTCNDEGNEKTIAYLLQNSLAGLDCLIPGEKAVIYIEAQTDCTVMPIHMSDVKELIYNNQEFAYTLLTHYCRILRQLCVDSENLSLNNSEKRLINFLLFNWNQGVDIKITQQEIATAINCSTSTVSRVLSKLAEKKVVEIQGLGLKILDERKLMELYNQ